MPRTLNANSAAPRTLSESQRAIQVGTYPGATTYPGADVYPGRGTDLTSAAVVPHTLTETSA